jgi:hypothetical protein
LNDKWMHDGNMIGYLVLAGPHAGDKQEPRCRCTTMPPGRSSSETNAAILARPAPLRKRYSATHPNLRVIKSGRDHARSRSAPWCCDWSPGQRRVQRCAGSSRTFRRHRARDESEPRVDGAERSLAESGDKSPHSQNADSGLLVAGTSAPFASPPRTRDGSSRGPGRLAVTLAPFQLPSFQCPLGP